MKKFCFRAVNRTFAEGSHRNFPSPKKGASPPFLRQKTVYWGCFSFKKASVLSQYERGIRQDAHFVSAQSLPSWRGRDWTLPSFHSGNSSLNTREGLDSAVIPFRQLLSQYERGIGRLGHFVSLAAQSLPSWRGRNWTLPSFHSGNSSLNTREGLDDSVTSFPSPPFGLRPEAVILDRAVFASLSRGQSNPRRGFSSPVF